MELFTVHTERNTRQHPRFYVVNQCDYGKHAPPFMISGIEERSGRFNEEAAKRVTEAMNAWLATRPDPSGVFVMSPVEE